MQTHTIRKKQCITNTYEQLWQWLDDYLAFPSNLCKYEMLKSILELVTNDGLLCINWLVGLVSVTIWIGIFEWHATLACGCERIIFLLFPLSLCSSEFLFKGTNP